MATRLGLGLPQMRQYSIGKDVPEVARAAEQIGYESLWVFERALFPEPATQGLYGIEGLAWPDAYRSVADPLVTLTLAAAATERAELGSSVLVAPLHLPFQLAKALATLDAASGGRVVAGLGTGWSLDEYAASGVRPFEERGEALDEIIAVCRAVWGPDPVVHEGPLTKIGSAVVGPKPARPIPVLLAAGNGRALRRLVDHADGWLPVGMGGRADRRPVAPAAGAGRGAGPHGADPDRAAGEHRTRGQAVRGHGPPALPGQRRPDRGGPRGARRDRSGRDPHRPAGHRAGRRRADGRRRRGV
ncbi:hypothetical protein GCM10017687_56920 [Streptomyces echinatus]|uniref:TIGR03619 family F420-dependent LLM class oxidoreductase n=1 Tax=Streptomyces echinatus TaxID=67293 RepID=UPI00338C38CB